MNRMFRVKICGLRDREAAAACVAAGADALGLNFYPTSPRYVSPHVAAGICETLPPEVARVGVFVNSPPETLRQIALRLNLNWLQLHGDETPEMLRLLKPWPIIRAFRPGKDGARPVLDYVEACRQAGQLPAAVLIDACRPGQYGGTGQKADWQLVAQLVRQLHPLPVILAGGLTPENVADAIHNTRPSAVDTASGVESGPGKKDLDRVREFVVRAHKALDSL